MYARLLWERFGSYHGLLFVNCGEPAIVCLDFVFLSVCIVGSYQSELLPKFPPTLSHEQAREHSYHGCRNQRRRTSVDADGPSLNDGNVHRERFYDLPVPG